MKLIITIDTEEDNWGDYKPTGQTFENIKRIPYLQDLFDEFNVKPTYLITYPVATDKGAVCILKKILEEGKCEIGAHCHPWNTPPFEEENKKINSMLCNLPPDLQYRKLKSLHDAIIDNFNIEPLSFRAGRWGYSQEVAKNLYKLGYQIDTSVTPFVNWKNCQGPDFSDVFPISFRFNHNSFLEASSNGNLLEVPVTIGFFQSNFASYNKLLKTLQASKIGKTGLIGLLYKLNLLNLVWLSPEFSNGKDMIKLTKALMKKNYKVINMTFHSSSLKTGMNQFVKTKKDEEKFINKIKEFLNFTAKEGIESIRLRDVTGLI